MSYHSAYDEQARIVRVTASGEVGKGDHYAAWNAALLLCRQHSCNKLLVDLRALSVNCFTVMECYDFGEAVSSTPDSICIAHVLPLSPKVRENVQFASDVQANRGKTIGDFETIEEAAKWLLGPK